MVYEKCAEVSEEIWNDLRERDPAEVTRRTGAEFREGVYRLPFLERVLLVDPGRRRIEFAGSPEADPGFRVCLTALLYLLHLDTAILGAPLSPLELPGGATFFRGHHGLPNGPLEQRFGQDLAGFRAAGDRLKAETRPAGDAALALQVFPGLTVELILWRGDEEFPAQVSFTLPAHLDRFWFLDAVLGLLTLATQELINAAPPPT
ncbi:MAG: DUF3786 domain-containing protein [Pseudomonadota bacterium]